MRTHLTLIVTVFFVCLLGHNAFAQDKDKPIKRYRIPKACVKFEKTGMEKGTEEVYFINYGNNEFKKVVGEIKIGPITQKNETLTYIKGRWIYNMQAGSKSGTKMENPLYEQMTQQNAADMGETILSQWGKKVGTGTVLGVECDIYELENLGTRTWVSKDGIPMKTVLKLGVVEQTITAVEISYEFDDDITNVPTDVNFSDNPAAGGSLEEIMKKMKPQGQK